MTEGRGEARRAAQLASQGRAEGGMERVAGCLGRPNVQTNEERSWATMALQQRQREMSERRIRQWLRAWSRAGVDAGAAADRARGLCEGLSAGGGGARHGLPCASNGAGGWEGWLRLYDHTTYESHCGLGVRTLKPASQTKAGCRQGTLTNACWTGSLARTC